MAKKKKKNSPLKVSDSILGLSFVASIVQRIRSVLLMTAKKCSLVETGEQRESGSVRNFVSRLLQRKTFPAGKQLSRSESTFFIDHSSFPFKWIPQLGCSPLCWTPPNTINNFLHQATTVLPANSERAARFRPSFIYLIFYIFAQNGRGRNGQVDWIQSHPLLFFLLSTKSQMEVRKNATHQRILAKSKIQLHQQSGGNSPVLPNSMIRIMQKGEILKKKKKKKNYTPNSPYERFPKGEI